MNTKTQESEIDQTLADSFPASDPPPWTLGVPASSEDEHPPEISQEQTSSTGEE